MTKHAQLYKSSCIKLLYETGSLKQKLYEELIHEYETLGSKIYNFREAVI
jgi:hypothetical protein